MLSIHLEATILHGKHAKITEERWRLITTVKHPPVSGREEDVKKTLENPDEVRRDTTRPHRQLYYKKFGVRYLCVVVEQLDSQAVGITVFPERKIRGGELIWHR